MGDSTGFEFNKNTDEIDPKKAPIVGKNPITSKKTSSPTINFGRPSLMALTTTRAIKMGYETKPWFWRLTMMTPEGNKILIEAMQQKIKSLQLPDDEDDATLEQIKTAIRNKLNNGDYKHIGDIKSLLENYDIAEPINRNTREQFARGIPNDIREAYLAIQALDDVSLEQRVDASGEYALREMLYAIEQAQFYRGMELKPSANGGFTLQKADLNDPSKTIEIVTATLRNTSGKDEPNEMIFELKEHSAAGVAALTDMISMMRQGNNNGIEITDIGDPIEALNFVQDLVCNKNMHVSFAKGIEDELMQGLNDLVESPEKNNLLKLATIVLGNKDTFSFADRKKISDWAKGRELAANGAKVVSAAQVSAELKRVTIPLLKDLESKPTPQYSKPEVEAKSNTNSNSAGDRVVIGPAAG